MRRSRLLRNAPLRARAASALALIPMFVFALLLGPAPARADLVNGSFETSEGSATLEGWHVTGGASVAEVPPGGGAWCLSLSKNLVAATAWQDVSPAPAAVPWRLTAWVRNDAASEGTVIVRWCVRRSFDPEVLEPLGEKQITFTEWTLVTLDVTPHFLKGDTLAVCLLVVSQMEDQHTGYVDLVSAGPLVPVLNLTWGRVKALYGEPNGGQVERGRNGALRAPGRSGAHGGSLGAPGRRLEAPGRRPSRAGSSARDQKSGGTAP